MMESGTAFRGKKGTYNKEYYEAHRAEIRAYQAQWKAERGGFAGQPWRYRIYKFWGTVRLGAAHHQREAIVGFLLMSNDVNATARRWGITRQRVHQIARKMGVERRWMRTTRLL